MDSQGTPGCPRDSPGIFRETTEILFYPQDAWDSGGFFMHFERACGAQASWVSQSPCGYLSAAYMFLGTREVFQMLFTGCYALQHELLNQKFIGLCNASWCQIKSLHCRQVIFFNQVKGAAVPCST